MDTYRENSRSQNVVGRAKFVIVSWHFVFCQLCLSYIFMLISLFSKVGRAGNKFSHCFYRILEQPFPGGTPIKKNFILIHKPKSNI